MVTTKDMNLYELEVRIAQAFRRVHAAEEAWEAASLDEDEGAELAMLQAQDHLAVLCRGVADRYEGLARG